MNKLDEIATRHVMFALDGTCEYCSDEPWPCDTAMLLPIAEAAVLLLLRLNLAGVTYVHKLAAYTKLARACEALEEDK